MNRFRNPILIGLIATGAIVSGVAVIDRAPDNSVFGSTKHCVLNEAGSTLTHEEATVLIELYKAEVAYNRGFTTTNITGCKDLFDKLDTMILNRLKRGAGAGITIEDLTPTEYRALLEALLIKRDAKNNDVLRGLRATKEESVRVVEF